MRKTQPPYRFVSWIAALCLVLGVSAATGQESAPGEPKAAPRAAEYEAAVKPDDAEAEAETEAEAKAKAEQAAAKKLKEDLEKATREHRKVLEELKGASIEYRAYLRNLEASKKEIEAREAAARRKRQGKKVKGPGDILVGNPEVITRERLVNDRLRQERWLEGQLEKTDEQEFGFQGITDMRSFFGLSARAGIEQDSNLLGIYDAQSTATIADIRRDQEQKALQNEIDTLDKLKTIRGLQADLEGSNGDGPTAFAVPTEADGGDADSGGDGDTESGSGDAETTEETEGSGGAAANPSKVSDGITLDFLDRLLNANRASLLPDPAKAETTDADASPIDVFRDRRAYREEIRNEIFENALDDRHDLRGNTAYRINIDATVLPKKKKDAWAVVEVEVTRPPDASWNYLLDQWKIDLEREINALTLTRLQAAIPCYGTSPGAQAAAPTGCLPEELERDLFDHFQRVLVRGEGWANVEDEANTLKLITQAYLENLGDPNGSNRDQLALHLRAAVNALAKHCVCETDDQGKPKEPKIWITVEPVVALAHMIASYHENLYSDVEGLEQWVWIEQPTCGDYPHLKVKFWNHCKYLKDDKERTVCISRKGGAKAKERSQIVEELNDVEHVYAFAATPKETVQRISEVAARRSSIELAAQLNSRSGSGAAEAILESQRLLHGIGRKPLVVGYTKADNYAEENTLGPSKAAIGGWILGPRFKISDAVYTWPWNKGFRYEHLPVQNNLALTISVPEWWNKARLTITREWRTLTGKRISKEFETLEHIVELPGTLKGITRALVQYRLPQVLEQGRWDVVHKQPASLLIRGSELWRSTQVTLGGQIDDGIQVLPNMQGIVARFEKVTELAGITGKTARADVPVRVWTSEGSQQAGFATIYPAKPEKPKALKLKVHPPRLIQGQDLTLTVTQGSIPEKRESLAVQLYVWNGEGFDPPIYFAPKDIRPDSGKKAVKVSLLASKVGDIPDASEVRVQLVINENERGAPKAINADNLVPFYSTEPKIGFAIKKAGEDTKELDGEVQLTTRKFMDVAFPGFGRDSQVVFKAGGHDLRLKVKTWTKKGDGTFELKSTFEDISAIKTTEPVPVTPKLEDAALADKINFNPEKLSLKKPTE